jgi:hypothetical protein
MLRPATESHRTNYFGILATVLTCIVVAGFWRTFFFRSLFRVPPLHGYIYLHGAVQVAWIVVFAVQTSLISAGRVRLHRRLGVLGAGVALLLVFVGAFTLVNLPEHFREGHLSNDTKFDLPSMTFVFWENWADLLTFSVLAGTGLVLRKHLATHKRLMLLATIRIAGAALVRVAGLIGRSVGPMATQQAQAAFTTAIIAVVLPMTLVLHDLMSTRRVHPATAAGVVINLLTGLAASAIAASSWGQEVFVALE